MNNPARQPNRSDCPLHDLRCLRRHLADMKGCVAVAVENPGGNELQPKILLHVIGTPIEVCECGCPTPGKFLKLMRLCVD